MALPGAGWGTKPELLSAMSTQRGQRRLDSELVARQGCFYRLTARRELSAERIFR